MKIVVICYNRETSENEKSKQEKNKTSALFISNRVALEPQLNPIKWLKSKKIGLPTWPEVEKTVLKNAFGIILHQRGSCLQIIFRNRSLYLKGTNFSGN